jgi:putative OPT family oligopeptide transporter
MPAENNGPTAFQPYVPASESPKEFTLSAVLLGTALGLVFAASSLYLVLKVGMTVSASIPVAVLAITLFRGFSRAFGFRRTTILENNIVQTAGSAGESIAFGAGVTMPALLLLGFGMDIGRVMVVSVLGGILGILAMIPLRRAFIVKMHGRPGQPGTLLYPEGTAAAQVLITAEQGGTSGKTVFIGFGLAFLHKFLVEGMNLFVTPFKFGLPFINKAAQVSIDMASEMLGVGYIIGVRTSSVMMAGAVLGYLVIIPTIFFIGEHATKVIPPGTKPIAEMSVKEIRNSYLLYIGAGTVATAGIISMIKTLPMIVSGVLAGLRTARAGAGNGNGPVKRTDDDMSMKVVLLGSVGLIVLLTLFLAGEVPWQSAILGAILVVLFGFMFVTVSARLTGEIGSSSNPISGMTTATLMITCLIFLAVGMTSTVDRVLALSVAGVVCIACSNGGTVAQSLKTGFLVGGTPKYMQYAILIGALVSALVIGFALIYVLNDPGTVYSEKPENVPALTLTKDEVTRLKQTETYQGKSYRIFDTHNEEELLVEDKKAGYVPRNEVKEVKPGRYLVDPDTGKLTYLKDDTIMGKLEQRDDGTPVKRQFDAPKTQVLGIVINGVLKQDLNWTMIAIGAMIALMLELCGVSALAFAVGVYVPINVSAPIFVGGLVRWAVDRRLAKQAAADLAAAGDDPEARAKAEVEAIRKSETSPGVLLASGYIAGGSIMGVVLAFTAFSETLPRDLSLFQYKQHVLTTEQSLPDAALEIAAQLHPGVPSAKIQEETKAIVDLNEEDLPVIWAKVPKGTELKLPRNQTYTAEADTTLGAVAEEKLGRDWMAGQILKLNKDKIKPAEKLPAGARINIPQIEYWTLIPFGILVLILLAVAYEWILKPKTEG